MNTVDKVIFRVFSVIIILLVSVMTLLYFRTKNNISVFTKKGNDIVKLVNAPQDKVITNKVYQGENKLINYPYVDGMSESTNEKIRTYAIEDGVVQLDYEIKFKNENFLSIVFFGKKGNSNYSKTLNIYNGDVIDSDEIFKDKNEMTVILKSVYASEQLENKGFILMQNYLESLSYEDLLNSDNINVYFFENGIGIILKSVPNSFTKYVGIEVNYNDLNNHFIEKQVSKEQVDENSIRDFILGNKLISLNDRIESLYPSGYVFTENGNFSYYHGEYAPVSTDELISYRGNWWIENNKILLHVLEEERISGGEIMNDELVNYKKIISSVDYTIEYEVNDIEGSFMVINNYDIVYFNLIPEGSYIENFKILADSGYKMYNQSIDKYYQTALN